jgi:hypothetical protein
MHFPAHKISNYKHHLILKLGQTNLKFQYSMTKTGRFERRVSYVWKFGALVIGICLKFAI